VRGSFHRQAGDPDGIQDVPEARVAAVCEAIVQSARRRLISAPRAGSVPTLTTQSQGRDHAATYYVSPNRYADKAEYAAKDR